MCLAFTALAICAASTSSCTPAPTGSAASRGAARGALVFAIGAMPADQSNVGLATEVEVIKSRPIVEQVVKDLRLDLGLDAGTGRATELLASWVAAERRGGSLVLDVSLKGAPDSAMAVAACNALMARYVERRREARIDRATEVVIVRQSELQAAMEADAGAERVKALRRRFEEADEQRLEGARESDVRVLEGCVWGK